MWPHIFAAATMNAFNSPSPKATSLMWPQFLANRVALLEGDYCLNKILLMVKHRHRSPPPHPPNPHPSVFIPSRHPDNSFVDAGIPSKVFLVRLGLNLRGEVIPVDRHYDVSRRAAGKRPLAFVCGQHIERLGEEAEGRYTEYQV